MSLRKIQFYNKSNENEAVMLTITEACYNGPPGC